MFARSSKNSRRRSLRLRLEALEDRRLLTVMINEIKVNPPGGDDNRYEYIELKGTPNASLNGDYFVTFNGTSANNPGKADMVFSLAGFSLGSNGLAVIKSSGNTGHTIPAPTPVIADDAFFTKTGGFDSGALSFYLFSSSSAFVSGTDYDTNNDGVLDHLPTGATVLDNVAILNTNSGTSSDHTYGGVVIQDVINTGTPDAVTRFPNATTIATASWYGGELTDTGNVDSTLTYDVTRPGTNEPSGATLTPGLANYPNQPPVLTASVSSEVYNQGGPAVVVDPGITLTDAESTTISSATVSLASQPGGVSLGFSNTAAISGSFSGSTLTLTGVTTLANYQAALRTITYQQSSFTTTSGGPVQFVVNDPYNPSNAAQVNITANAAPALAGPSTASVNHGATLAFTGGSQISVSDVDASGNETVALAVNSGTLSASLAGGAAISAGANGSAAFTLRGTIAQLNAALATLVYTAPASGASATLTAQANDGSTSSSVLSVAIALTNPAGLLGDMNGDGTVNNFDIAPFQLALTDPNAYQAQFPTLTDYQTRGDINQDGTFNNFDISYFEQLLTGSGAATVGSNLTQNARMVSNLAFSTTFVTSAESTNQSAAPVMPVSATALAPALDGFSSESPVDDSLLDLLADSRGVRVSQVR